MNPLLNAWVVREVIRPALDVLILAYLLYKSWQILVQTRAVQLLKGTVVMLLIYAVSFFLRLATLLWILNVLVPGLVIAIAIIFQPELRKIFTQIGSREWFRAGVRAVTPSVETLMGAVETLSARRRGALIVLPRRVGVKNIVQTGTPLNAELSINLLTTIFFEGTAAARRGRDRRRGPNRRRGLLPPPVRAGRRGERIRRPAPRRPRAG